MRILIPTMMLLLVAACNQTEKKSSRSAAPAGDDALAKVEKSKGEDGHEADLKNDDLLAMEVPLNEAPMDISADDEPPVGHVEETQKPEPIKEPPGPPLAEEIPLSLTLNPGSQSRLLDGYALTAVYSRIFAKETFGYHHCRRSLTPNSRNCQESIFAESELLELGSFGLDARGHGFSNTQPVKDLTLNYMRYLRQGLQRECAKLVDTEWDQLGKPGAENNKLVHQAEGAPSQESLDSFMRLILGVPKDLKGVDTGSADFHKAALAVLEAGKDDRNQEGLQKHLYLNLCISMSMDPQVLLY